MKENKYRELFNTDMPHEEALTVLYTVLNTCPEEDIPLIKEAFSAVVPGIMERELKEIFPYYFFI